MPRQEWGGRRRRAALAVLLAGLLAATAGPAAARLGRGTVSGTVTDMAGAPLEGVEVSLEAADGERLTTTTDRRGRFKLEATSGELRLALAKDGYAPFESPLTLEPGGRPVLTVGMLDAETGRRSAAAPEFNAGAAALRAGDKAAARGHFEAAVAADPSLIAAHRELAEIYLEDGAPAAALAAAETVLAAEPEDRPALLVAYEARRELGDGTGVVELRARLAGDAELAPKLATHAFNEGAAADQAGDAATAAARFREALGLDPGLAPAHFAVAALEYRARRYEEAAAALAGGLELEPTSAQGRRLAYAIADGRGDAPAAAAALDAYAEVDAAGAAELLFERGEREFQNGDLEPARARLARAIELRPDHAHGHRVLGLAHLTGDTTLARRHLERFLELAPEDGEAATVREILARLD